ncbi:hypothetical protein HY605_05655 [Candidatus Peregrinibacteria bacterium]|nr:hypothetical protein [Candidatus Peregrinibacteria bacterium]
MEFGYLVLGIYLELDVWDLGFMDGEYYEVKRQMKNIENFSSKSGIS